MYIALDWINELISIENVKLEDLIETLTLGGFEVEDILTLNISNQKQKSIILDISATANRADSLSIKGMTKEIAALLNKEIKFNNYKILNNQQEDAFKKIIKLSPESNIYSNFISLTVENLTTLTSPKWIKEKLVASQIEPLDNLLDFQQYILLETGYPFEFYDLKKIQNLLKTDDFKLKITPANNNLEFIANNNNVYKLNSQIFLLEANNYPLSIAGIIPNENVSYQFNSNSLLIEAAIYKSKKIRQQSRTLGLRTDRSARYEKDINDSDLIRSIIRLISLLKVSNPDLICNIHTTSKIKQTDLVHIILKYETINETLGPIIDRKNECQTFLQPQQISDYLNRLNFKFNFDKLNLIWDIEIPTYRMGDIEREIDLIEEIGRLHGFNNFLTNLPSIDRIGMEDSSYQIRKKLINCFLNEGFNEIIQYSLINDSNENNIKLVNPLVKDCSTLRTTLLPKLIELITENIKQSNLLINGFEFGHVFSGNIEKKYFENEKVGGIFGGLKIKRQWDEIAKPLSWFEAKAKIEEIFQKLNISIYWTKSLSKDYIKILHPYRTADIKLMNGITVGVFGQINPIIARNNNISSDLFLFEFDIDILKEKLKEIPISLYEQYSVYPKITKDISFIINQNITFNEIKRTLLENGNKLLKNIELLDQYKGKSIPENHTSLCVQLVFQSKEKTLINKDIEEIIKNLQSLLEKKYQIILRI
jgi:phenylalanyl-tRNA synthetase beta chain